MSEQNFQSPLYKFYQYNLVKYFEEVNKFFDRISLNNQKASEILSNMSNNNQNNIQYQIQQLQQLFQSLNINQEINRIKEMQTNIEISISITPSQLQKKKDYTPESEEISSLQQQNKIKEAKQKFEQEIENNPKNTKALNCLGIILTNEKHFEEAIECFDKSLVQDPFNEYTYLYKASALNQNKRNEEAFIQCLIALDCNEQQQNCYLYINYILSDMKSQNLAMYYVDKAIKNISENPCFYIEKGKLLLKQPLSKESKKIQQALDCYNKALNFKMNNESRSECLVGKAKSLAFMEKNQEAIKLYEEAIQLDDTDKSKIQDEINQLKARRRNN